MSKSKSRPLQVGDVCLTVNSKFPAINNGLLVTITAVDASWENLVWLKNQLDKIKDLDKTKVRLAHADFEKIPFVDGSFDIEFSNAVIDPTRDDFRRCVEGAEPDPEPEPSPTPRLVYSATPRYGYGFRR